MTEAEADKKKAEEIALIAVVQIGASDYRELENDIFAALAEARSDERKAAVAETREQCAKAAESAKLPAHFQWGHDAMEQFNFGKKRAAEAIRKLEKRG